MSRYHRYGTMRSDYFDRLFNIRLDLGAIMIESIKFNSRIFDSPQLSDRSDQFHRVYINSMRLIDEKY